MTSNDDKKIDHHGNRNDLTPEGIINAINYPPGYPDNKQQEKCNKNEEKSIIKIKNCLKKDCKNRIFSKFF